MLPLVVTLMFFDYYNSLIMKTTNSQLTDTRAFLQRTLKGGTAIAGERVTSLNRPGSGLPATNWSASKGSSEKKPLF